MYSNPPASRWSQCSKNQLQKSFSEGLDYCLHNVPQTIYDSTPDCGNGIVDHGEECDCGNAPVSVTTLIIIIIIIIIIIFIMMCNIGTIRAIVVMEVLTSNKYKKLSSCR